MSRSERPRKIAGAVLVGLSLVACSDNQSLTPPAKAALEPTIPPTREVIDTPKPLPDTLNRPETRIPQTPTPTIVYEATESPQRFDKRDLIVGEENKNEVFVPSHKLDLDKMHLTDRERENLEYWRDLIEKMSKYYDWDANLSAAMMISESGGVNGLVNDQMDAAGLWGILANHNGSPSVEALMDPFVNATWHYAKMVDLCKVQGDTLTNSIIRYGGWEQETEFAIEYRNKILTRAGYMTNEGDLLIANRCESIESVPKPPMKNDLNVELP